MPDATLTPADVHARNTAEQPTQIMGTRINWPRIQTITSTVDTTNSAGAGYYGGSLPDHSQHWSDYLTSMWQILPNGKDTAFVSNPDPTPVAGLISQQQDAASGNGENPWQTLSDNFAKMWRKGAPPSTYKLPHP